MKGLKIKDIRPTKLLKKTNDVVSGSLKIQSFTAEAHFTFWIYLTLHCIPKCLFLFFIETSSI